MSGRRALILGGGAVLAAPWAPRSLAAPEAGEARIKIIQETVGFGKTEAIENSLLLVRYTGTVAASVCKFINFHWVSPFIYFVP